MGSTYDFSLNLPGETDLFSGATRMVPHPDEDPRPWLGDVASGNGQLLTFIHEATHNWCFTSALVHAQLHVMARAQINALAFARSAMTMTNASVKRIPLQRCLPSKANSCTRSAGYPNSSPA